MLWILSILIIFLNYLASIFPLIAYINYHGKSMRLVWSIYPLVNFTLVYKLAKMPAGLTFAALISLFFPPLCFITFPIFLFSYMIAWYKISMTINRNPIVSVLIGMLRIFPIDFGLISALYFMATDEALGKNKKRAKITLTSKSFIWFFVIIMILIIGAAIIGEEMGNPIVFLLALIIGGLLFREYIIKRS